MIEMTLRELQLTELEILLAFDAVCKQHGLRYYIDGGTLLGAVCYDGFIPWDDDIDLKMPRPDYEQLLTLQSAFPAHLHLVFPSRSHCKYAFAKLEDSRTVIRGEDNNPSSVESVYIDILPMDGHPEDEVAYKKHLATILRLNNLFHASQTGFHGVKSGKTCSLRMKGRLYSIIYSPWKLYRKITKTAKKYSYDSASRVGLLVEGDPIRERFEKSWLEPPAMLEFEGHLFPAPNAAEEHLSIFYRKPISRELYYQRLPKIPSGHMSVAFWKEDTCQN